MTPAGCARLLALIAPIALTASCGSVPTRETPLNQVVPLTAPVLAPGVEANSDKLFVVVTFSGGGKRAAAFSYGVLEALRDIQVTTPDGELHSLLDEVDLISAVSGGAFTAAYYALHGHETFESYAPRFLNHDTEKDLWHKVLAPVNWGRLGNSLVSRSDLEVEYFDEKLFNGATVNDVMTRSPRVIITATDLVRAKPFAFTREQLNGICVDPRSVPVARAVFASAATPVYFAPLVMHNYAGRCGYQPPDGLNLSSSDEEDAYRRERAERLVSFLDSTSYPYLHLADGAFADNLGARAILDEVALGDTVTDALRRNGFSRARRMLFIVVDARTGFDRRYAQVPEPLGIKKVMDAVVSATFNRYSFETMNLLRARVKRWENEVRTTRCQSAVAIPDCGEFDVDLVELSFEQVKDDDEREYLDRIPTSFTLSTEEIIRLRRAAHLLVEESPELRHFLEESGKAAPTAR
ncbi:MAG TPA: patatin-like phospholipase family protein [Steroidobacteraceae bacterium]|jgi:NTE family protein|nr:patatin-like phospholipase family protein [Steroidobacteraceae bacterium]